MSKNGRKTRDQMARNISHGTVHKGIQSISRVIGNEFLINAKDFDPVTMNMQTTSDARKNCTFELLILQSRNFSGTHGIFVSQIICTFSTHKDEQKSQNIIQYSCYQPKFGSINCFFIFI